MRPRSSRRGQLTARSYKSDNDVVICAAVRTPMCVRDGLLAQLTRLQHQGQEGRLQGTLRYIPALRSDQLGLAPAFVLRGLSCVLRAQGSLSARLRVKYLTLAPGHDA